ncbi:unnamed protein product [Cochlearia groenlandica]
MEETSDRLEPTTDALRIAAKFDSLIMRSTKPGLKRLFSFLLALPRRDFVRSLGLPFLWKSVEIYRSPLPFHDIDTLSETHVFQSPRLFNNPQFSPLNCCVKHSLKAAMLAQSNASLGVFSSSASSSREARSLAENAFFHPSIMSVSFFSYQHCLSVYTVSFLVSTTVIIILSIFSLVACLILSWTAIFCACCITRSPCRFTRMEKIQTREGKVLDLAYQKEVSLGHCGNLNSQSSPLAHSQILCNF